jgi:hypothetical protein
MREVKECRGPGPEHERYNPPLVSLGGITLHLELRQLLRPLTGFVYGIHATPFHRTVVVF